ncbi:hypothetical protein K7432_017806 [Basidiobolus ranarum]|uniref:Uncharacterized protein n=1 Tax=Basidiobolus ranarum TaxID=34480 RepID=A0ABR2VJW0_9FUNG
MSLPRVTINYFRLNHSQPQSEPEHHLSKSFPSHKDFQLLLILLQQPTGLYATSAMQVIFLYLSKKISQVVRNLLEVILDKDIADLFIEEVKEYLEWDLFDHTFKQHIDSPLFAPLSLEKELVARFTSLLKNSPSLQVTSFLKNYYSEQAVELHSPLDFDIEHLWEIANSKIFN